jgi:hypothetical protein
MGAYEDIRDAPAADRSRLRVQATVGVGSRVGASVGRGERRLTILEGPDAVPGGVRVVVSVTRMSDGVDVTPTGLNPVTIINPPLLVPDASGPIQSDGRSYRLDPAAALMEALRGVLG